MQPDWSTQIIAIYLIGQFKRKKQLGQLRPQAIRQAKETVKRQLQEAEVVCDQVLTVEILKYLTCVSCKKKVQ